MNKEPQARREGLPAQLKTVPLTAEGLAAARAAAAALSAANSRESKSPPREKIETGSVSAVTAEKTPRKRSRGTMLTLAAIAGLVVVCAGAGLVQRNNKTVVATAPVEAMQPPVANAAAAPAPPAETAVGFAVAARPPTEPAAAEPAPVVAAPVAVAPVAPVALAPEPVAAPEPIAKHPRRAPAAAAPAPEPAAKAEPPAPKPKAVAAAPAPEEKKPTPAAAPAPASVDALLQQQLKSAIP